MQNLGISPLLAVSLLCLGQTPGDLSRWATVDAKQATLIDVLNGTETSLNIKRVKNDLVISKVHAESWPRILRILE